MKLALFAFASLLATGAYASEADIKAQELEKESHQALSLVTSTLNVAISTQPIKFRGVVKSLDLSKKSLASNLEGVAAKDMECTLTLLNYQGPKAYVTLNKKGDDNPHCQYWVSINFNETSYADEDNYTKTSAIALPKAIKISQIKMSKTYPGYRGGGSVTTKNLMHIAITPQTNNQIEQVDISAEFRQTDFWNLVPVPQFEKSKDMATCINLKLID